MMERGLLVGGDWTPASGGDVVEVRDPGTGDVVGRSSVAKVTDVDAAVNAASAAQRAWGRTHPDERARILLAGADLVEQRIEGIARAITLEQGKPLADSRKEIGFGIEVLRYYAEQGRRVAGSLRPSASSDIRSIVEHRPVGPVGAIVPWNYPVDLYCWKVAPALAAGCTVVAKPPPEAPFGIGMVAAALVEAGLPSGVLSDLPGGADIGRALVAHPGIRMVTATASTPAGRDIMRTAAERMARVSLELGGQTPMLVLADADVAEAARAALRRSFSNMGQICISVNRLLVDERVADDLVDALAEGARSLRIGHGLDEEVAYGPLTTDGVLARTTEHLADAVARGARVVVGGTPLEVAGYPGGRWFAPAVVDDVPDGARVLREETFGPVAAVRRLSGVDDIVRAANDSDHGLAAYVYTEDLERGWAVASELEVGAVGVNVNDVTELQAPFGGWKLSGLGRELGEEGLRAYLEPRHVRMRVRRDRVTTL